MNGEIIVNTQELEQAEKRLSALLQKTQNRRIRATISKSRGAFVKELNDCSHQLNSLSDALQKLFAETYLTNSIPGFEVALDLLTEVFIKPTL